MNPGGYSEPNQNLWQYQFSSSEFDEKLFSQVSPGEWWWDPYWGYGGGIQNGDTEIWQYNICIDPNIAFYQEGTAARPLIYWLAIKIYLPAPSIGYEFGWKTSYQHWNDNAVVSLSNGANWTPMIYPTGHPWHPNLQPIDMSFVITREAPWVYPPCWDWPTQCHGDIADQDGDVDTVDWPVFRSGFGKDYPVIGYLNNVCADLNRDGHIDTVDWPEFRTRFGKPSVPSNCVPGDYNHIFP